MCVLNAAYYHLTESRAELPNFARIFFSRNPCHLGDDTTLSRPSFCSRTPCAASPKFVWHDPRIPTDYHTLWPCEATACWIRFKTVVSRAVDCPKQTLLANGGASRHNIIQRASLHACQVLVSTKKIPYFGKSLSHFASNSPAMTRQENTKTGRLYSTWSACNVIPSPWEYRIAKQSSTSSY